MYLCRNEQGFPRLSEVLAASTDQLAAHHFVALHAIQLDCTRIGLEQKGHFRS